MITIPLNFNFDDQEQADTAVEKLAQSFNYSESEGDKLAFVKFKIAELLKARIIAQVQASAIEQAAQAGAQLLQGATVA